MLTCMPQVNTGDAVFCRKRLHHSMNHKSFYDNFRYKNDEIQDPIIESDSRKFMLTLHYLKLYYLCWIYHKARI